MSSGSSTNNLTEFPYKCHYCGESFMLNMELIDHQWRKHRDEIHRVNLKSVSNQDLKESSQLNTLKNERGAEETETKVKKSTNTSKSPTDCQMGQEEKVTEEDESENYIIEVENVTSCYGDDIMEIDIQEEEFLQCSNCGSNFLTLDDFKSHEPECNNEIQIHYLIQPEANLELDAFGNEEEEKVEAKVKTITFKGQQQLFESQQVNINYDNDEEGTSKKARNRKSSIPIGKVENVEDRVQSESGYKRPQLNNSCLVALAIKNSPSQVNTSHNVIEFVAKVFPYFGKYFVGKEKWKNCLRAALGYAPFKKINNKSSSQNKGRAFIYGFDSEPESQLRVNKLIQEQCLNNEAAIKSSMRHPEDFSSMVSGNLCMRVDEDEDGGDVQEKNEKNEDEQCLKGPKATAFKNLGRSFEMSEPQSASIIDNDIDDQVHDNDDEGEENDRLSRWEKDSLQNAEDKEEGNGPEMVELSSSYERPELTFNCLAGLAIKNSPTQTTTCQQFREFVTKVFPYFRYAGSCELESRVKSLHKSNLLKKYHMVYPGQSKPELVYGFDNKAKTKLRFEDIIREQCLNKEAAIKSCMKHPEDFPRLVSGNPSILMEEDSGDDEDEEENEEEQLLNKPLAAPSKNMDFSRDQERLRYGDKEAPPTPVDDDDEESKVPTVSQRKQRSSRRKTRHQELLFDYDDDEGQESNQTKKRPKLSHDTNQVEDNDDDEVKGTRQPRKSRKKKPAQKSNKVRKSAQVQLQSNKQRPELTIKCLIALAIKNSSSKAPTTREIFEFAAKVFPYFQHPGNRSWKKSVSHALCTSSLFNSRGRKSKLVYEFDSKTKSRSRIEKLIQEECMSDKEGIKRCMRQPEDFSRMVSGDLCPPTEEEEDEGEDQDKEENDEEQFLNETPATATKDLGFTSAPLKRAGSDSAIIINLDENVYQVEGNDEQDEEEESNQVHQHQTSYQQPKLTFSCLIALAIKNSPTWTVTSHETLKFASKVFPYFKFGDYRWRKSVSDGLSKSTFLKKTKIIGHSRSPNQPKIIYKFDSTTKSRNRIEKLIQDECINNETAIKSCMRQPEDFSRMVSGDLCPPTEENDGDNSGRQEFEEEDDDEEDQVLNDTLSATTEDLDFSQDLSELVKSKTSTQKEREDSDEGEDGEPEPISKKPKATTFKVSGHSSPPLKTEESPIFIDLVDDDDVHQVEDNNDDNEQNETSKSGGKKAVENEEKVVESLQAQLPANYQQPKLTLNCLVTLAIWNSQTKERTFDEILKFLAQVFPYFEDADKRIWKAKLYAPLCESNLFTKINNNKSIGGNKEGVFYGFDAEVESQNRIKKLIQDECLSNEAAIKSCMRQPETFATLVFGSLYVLLGEDGGDDRDQE